MAFVMKIPVCQTVILEPEWVKLIDVSYGPKYATHATSIINEPGSNSLLVAGDFVSKCLDQGKSEIYYKDAWFIRLSPNGAIRYKWIVSPVSHTLSYPRFEVNDYSIKLNLSGLIPGFANLRMPRAIAIATFDHLGFWGSRDELIMVIPLYNKAFPQISNCCNYPKELKVFNTIAKTQKAYVLFKGGNSLHFAPSSWCTTTSVPPFACGGIRDSIGVEIIKGPDAPIDKWR